MLVYWAAKAYRNFGRGLLQRQILSQKQRIAYRKGGQELDTLSETQKEHLDKVTQANTQRQRQRMRTQINQAGPYKSVRLAC